MTTMTPEPAPFGMEALIEQLVITADAVHAPRRNRKWSDGEIKFLRESMGYLTEPEIGAILGRPWKGVHLKRKRLGIPPTSQTPGWLAVEQARLKLGMKDGRPISGWVRRGFVKGHILGGPRKICMVHEISLRRFVLNPMNWPRFEPERVCDPWLRRLLERQRKRWGDEWLTPQQASKLIGLDVRQIQQYVKMGRLTAVHMMNKDGRGNEQTRWAHYLVLRSEIERVKIYKRGDAIRMVTPAALAWIRKALDMGWSVAAIGRSMKRNNQTVDNWCRQQRWQKARCPCP
jgi:hypothetical protein